MTHNIFQRAELVLGRQALERIAQRRVIVFGVGGVGSWCAEALVRTGITHLTIVDSDTVAPSNINRQLMATTTTLGQPKVEALRQRLLDINPEAHVTALQATFCEETVAQFSLGDYDYIVDAIDSLKDKALLILRACQTGGTLFASMGAALKTDPSRIRATEFWKVEGDPLARALRHRFKAMGQFPARKFQCVYSDEKPITPVVTTASSPTKNGEETTTKGSLVHITAIFGFTLASLVLRHAAQTETLTSPAPLKGEEKTNNDPKL
ncbi:MAG: tRNA threonylcarbamoyladenosine dehydratase [Prevotella sp.]|nr:tRNA threonylcarbamoyladenosine dehydratase [Prevotella sp.]